MIMFFGVFLFGIIAQAQSCLDLFKGDTSAPTKTTEQQTRTERRGHEKPLNYTPKDYSHSQILIADYLPPQTRLTFSYGNNQVRLFHESIVTVTAEGIEIPKVKSIEIPLDLHLPFVINASTTVGRNFYRACQENGRGTLIFIDLNDLGWINNNFALKSKAGDEFILAVNRAIQQITHKQGLVFRLGGDEIGILIPLMKPEELNIVLKIIESKSKEFAQKVFDAEQRVRYVEFVKAEAEYKEARLYPQYFTKAELIAYELQYFEKLARFQDLAKYLSPSVSIGATYIGLGRTADVIQADVESKSHPHKIAIKQSTNKPVGKYSTDPTIVNYVIAPLRADFNYDFPLLPDMTGAITHPRPRYNFNLPQVEWTRIRTIHAHIGPYTISEFRPEYGPLVLKVEVYENGKLVDLVDLHTHENTGFYDAQTVMSQKLMTALRQSGRYREGWVDLRNLGILNYFLNLSKTGDQALARVAQIIQGVLGTKGMAFKLKGSEFSFFIEVEKMNAILPKLNVLFNSDPILRQIYTDQINYLVRSGASAEQIANIQKFLDQPATEQPLVKFEMRN